MVEICVCMSVVAVLLMFCYSFSEIVRNTEAIKVLKRRHSFLSARLTALEREKHKLKLLKDETVNERELDDVW